MEIRQPGLQYWYRLNRTSPKKRIVMGGPWSVLCRQFFGPMAAHYPCNRKL